MKQEMNEDKNFYLDPVKLETNILRDLKNKKLSEESKNMIFLLIEKLLSKSNFNGYDEDVKKDMMVLAYEYITRYWKNFVPDKILYSINKEEKSKIKNFLKYLKIEKETNNKIYFTENKNINKNIEIFLKKNNIEYQVSIKKNSIFAYFTQIIKNAFLQVINNVNKKFLYKIGKTRYSNNASIYSLNREDKNEINYLRRNLKYNKDFSVSFEDNWNFDIERDIEKVYKLINKYKKEKNKENLIIDRNYVVKALLDVAYDLESLSLLSYKVCQDSSLFKKVYKDKTMIYLLSKINFSF